MGLCVCFKSCKVTENKGNWDVAVYGLNEGLKHRGFICSQIQYYRPLQKCDFIQLPLSCAFSLGVSRVVSLEGALML